VLVISEPLDPAGHVSTHSPVDSSVYLVPITGHDRHYVARAPEHVSQLSWQSIHVSFQN